MRLIWIGYYKNRKNNSCLIAKLPKDIVRFLLQMLFLGDGGEQYESESETENV